MIVTRGLGQPERGALVAFGLGMPGTGYVPPAEVFESPQVGSGAIKRKRGINKRLEGTAHIGMPIQISANATQRLAGAFVGEISAEASLSGAMRISGKASAGIQMGAKASGDAVDMAALLLLLED